MTTTLEDVLNELRALRTEQAEQANTLASLLGGQGSSVLQSDLKEASGIQPPRENGLSVILRTQYYPEKKVEVVPAHMEGTKQSLNKFVNWLPDGIQVRGITKEVMVNYKADLLTRMGMKPVTLNKHIGTISAFMVWAVANGHADTNAATGLKLKVKRDVRDERKAFDKPAIKGLFDGILKGREKSSNAWIPLLMAFSGLRSSEAASLLVGDLKRLAPDGSTAPKDSSDAVWVFDLRNGNRKNASSRRIVPIHKRLLELGLIEKLCDAPATDFLFRDIKKGSNDRRAAASGRWFSRTWLPKQGLVGDGLCQYSLRHSFITGLLQNKVAESVVSTLAGHSDASMTTGRYLKGYPVKDLAQAVETLTWEV